ncbi:MAG: peptidylprolyl isomerase [Planctomycetota bacterium]
MRPSARVPALLVASLLPLVAAPRARGADAPAAPAAPADVAVPAGIPITLDGRLDPGEWADAAPVALGVPGLTVRTKHARGAWMFGLALPDRWPLRHDLRLYVTPAPPAGAPDEASRYDRPGSSLLDVEPNEHNRPHAFLQVRVAPPDGPPRWTRTDDRALVRFDGLRKAATAEVVVPLDVLGVTGRDAASLRWTLAWSMPGRTPSLVTFPAGLDLGAAAPGTLPQDFASTARWARTTFAEPTGPGLFPKATLDALVAESRELTERGERAHRTVLALLGAFDEQPVEPTKVDAPLEAALDDLRWLSLREPWSREDGRAFATALWKLNRAPEALGVLRAMVGDAPWTDHLEELRLAAMVAQGAERFEEAEALWTTLADALPPEAAGTYRRYATTVKEVAAQYRATLEARKADDAKDDLPLVLLRTSRGDVTLRLLEDDCPEAVKHFVHLVEATKTADGVPFYDGTRFHRVVGAGLVQGGDPTSRGEGCATAGSGGSPWTIAPEPNARHGMFRGSVGFAMALDRRIRSQFFVMTTPKPELAADGFACFATVVAGMDVVDRLQQCDTLIQAKVLRKRDHAYVPEKR